MHARWVYDTLIHCTAATVTEFAANVRWLGRVGALTLVLHTWSLALRRHIQVHALMACGALRSGAEGAGSWVTHARDFMCHVAGIEIECCPHCQRGRWRVVQELAADRAALASIVPATCRGPP